MSDLPVEGSHGRLLRMGTGERIVEVHWGNFALLEIFYPNAFDYRFSISRTQTVKSYGLGETIEKKGAPDSQSPLIEILFIEHNPLDIKVFDRFEFRAIQSDPILWVYPPIEVINDPGYHDEDQARIDAKIAATNAILQAGYDKEVALAPAGIAGFMALHPDAEIFPGISDLRFPGNLEPSDGWGTRTLTYLPLPWFSNGGGDAPSTPGGPVEFTFPGYLTYAQLPDQLLEPKLIVYTWAKWPLFDNPARDNFIIDLNKLGDNTVDIIVTDPTENSAEGIQLYFYTGNMGTLTVGELRTVLSTSVTINEVTAPPPPAVPTRIKTQKFVSGAHPRGTIIARFDRNGFVLFPS